MDVRPGLLYAVPELIRVLDKQELLEDGLVASFPTISEIPTPAVLTLALQAGWIVRDTRGRLGIGEQGRRVERIPDPVLALRVQLAQVIAATRPKWASSIVQGRAVFRTTAPADAVQCFQEAALLDGEDQDAIHLIDQMAAIMRGARHDANMETGRLGERLTVAYEEHRTGLKPKWIALETNGEGYDVLSVRSKQAVQKHYIEVKSSKSPLTDATLFLSRYEWLTAGRVKDYSIHCWLLAGAPRLLVVPRSAVGRHVPDDNGQGEWRTVEIPFAELAKYEEPVPPEVAAVVS